MSKPLVYRQNRLFRINEDLLPESARNLQTIQKLYYAMYLEFKGAEYSDKYSKLSYQERMEKINDFSKNWLKSQGHKIYGG